MALYPEGTWYQIHLKSELQRKLTAAGMELVEFHFGRAPFADRSKAISKAVG